MTTTEQAVGRTAADGEPPATPTTWRRARRLAVGFGVVAAVAWTGLQITPRPFPQTPLERGSVATVPLPAGLPGPVERFYTVLYGQDVPVVDTAVITGRGTMRVAGITFPARWRFTHDTGRNYRHDIELTVFGATVVSVDERFVDGQARLDLPMGVSEGPNIDQGANLALWAEAVWMPSVWVTDDAVRWEPIDDTSARLVVPFHGDDQVLTVRFDPATGLLERMESLRFKGEDDEHTTPWTNEVVGWGDVDGHHLPVETAVTWGDEDGPWAVLTTDAVIYDADLDRDLEPLTR